jgi:hypothetical protein
MNSRRKFLQQSSAFLAASVFAPRFLSAQTFTSRPVGIQLFTFFGKFDQDVKGNLQKIAELGYTEMPRNCIEVKQQKKLDFEATEPLCFGSSHLYLLLL